VLSAERRGRRLRPPDSIRTRERHEALADALPGVRAEAVGERAVLERAIAMPPGERSRHAAVLRAGVDELTAQRWLGSSCVD